MGTATIGLATGLGTSGAFGFGAGAWSSGLTGSATSGFLSGIASSTSSAGANFRPKPGVRRKTRFSSWARRFSPFPASRQRRRLFRPLPDPSSARPRIRIPRVFRACPSARDRSPQNPRERTELAWFPRFFRAFWPLRGEFSVPPPAAPAFPRARRRNSGFPPSGPSANW